VETLESIAIQADGLYYLRQGSTYAYGRFLKGKCVFSLIEGLDLH
jgi:hypothetical protein